jgi:DNA-binding response OmpR family regulator
MGLQTLENQPVDAVVLDLNLPDAMGGKILRRLQRTLDGPEWVVITTMDREDVYKMYGPVEGRFIAMPFDPWRLVSTLRTMLHDRSKNGARPSSTERTGPQAAGEQQAGRDMPRPQDEEAGGEI